MEVIYKSDLKDLLGNANNSFTKRGKLYRYFSILITIFQIPYVLLHEFCHLFFILMFRIRVSSLVIHFFKKEREDLYQCILFRFTIHIANNPDKLPADKYIIKKALRDYWKAAIISLAPLLAFPLHFMIFDFRWAMGLCLLFFNVMLPSGEDVSVANKMLGNIKEINKKILL